MSSLISALRRASGGGGAGVDSTTTSPTSQAHDVLSAVPPLPSQMEDDVMDTVEATSDLTNSSSTTGQNLMPHVRIHIPIEAVPPELQTGVSEIARTAVRGNVKLCKKEGHGWMGVGGAIDPKGKGERGEWWWNVGFERDDSLAPRGLAVSVSADTFVAASSSASSGAYQSEPFVVTIRYSRPCEAFRGLGHVLGVTRGITKALGAIDGGVVHPNLADESGTWALDAREASAKLVLQENALFETLGTMIDCSRNGVLRVESVRFLCRKLALMGYNMLQLYTEETYKIPSEPFFGYLRGGFTESELREIDEYAFDLGIEVIPCIQTLGHLGQMLQWPRFLGLRDTTEVLLADWPETYAMLEKMIQAATRPFRTKKIHLGMDETHGLGHGRYHSIFGQHNYKEPTQIFVEHLQRVNNICLRMGLQPMIWSDMLFCLNAKNNSLLGYYDSAQPTKVDGIPANVDLVYWDYYHTSTNSYTERIASHVQLGRKPPWMAAGSWTWSRFWTALPFTFATCKASQNASKAEGSGVKHVFLTIWGDEGNEVDLYSSLPAWSYYAEHAYTKEEDVDLDRLRASFDGIVGASFADFVIASKLDDASAEKQSIDDRIHFAPNTSKWLLWEEPAFGFVTPSVQASGLDLERHYTELEAYLSARLSFSPSVPINDPDSPPRSLLDHPFNARLRMPQLLAKTLALKAGLRLRMHRAYLARDWEELQRLGGRGEQSRLGQLRIALGQLQRYHRQLWMSMYKPFGWEILELRYGGLRSRVDTMHARTSRFLDHIAAGGKVGVPLPLADSSSSEGASPFRIDSDVMLDPTLAESTSAGEEYQQPVFELPELAERLEVVYASSEQLLDYHRVSRPTYC